MKGIKNLIVLALTMLLATSIVSCGKKENKKITDSDVTFNYEIKNKESGEGKISITFSEGLPAITYDIYENDKEILAGDHEVGENKSVDVAITQKKGEKYTYRLTVKDDKGNVVNKEMHFNIFDDSDNKSSDKVEKENTWNSKSIEYKVGDIVVFNEKNYECIQGHTSQVAWTPADAPSLWKLKSEE
ncbi:MAG: carbohydrate-binding protein [Clostridium sp.]